MPGPPTVIDSGKDATAHQVPSTATAAPTAATTDGATQVRGAVVSNAVREVASARRLVLEGVALGLERGQASPDAAAAVATSDLLFDLIVGTLVHRVLVRGEDVDDTFVEQLVAAVLAVLSSAMPTMPTAQRRGR